MDIPTSLLSLICLTCRHSNQVSGLTNICTDLHTASLVSEEEAEYEEQSFVAVGQSCGGDREIILVCWDLTGPASPSHTLW